MLRLGLQAPRAKMYPLTALRLVAERRSTAGDAAALGDAPLRNIRYIFAVTEALNRFLHPGPR